MFLFNYNESKSRRFEAYFNLLTSFAYRLLLNSGFYLKYFRFALWNNLKGITFLCSVCRFVQSQVSQLLQLCHTRRPPRHAIHSYNLYNFLVSLSFRLLTSLVSPARWHLIVKVNLFVPSLEHAFMLCCFPAGRFFYFWLLCLIRLCIQCWVR